MQYSVIVYERHQKEDGSLALEQVLDQRFDDLDLSKLSIYLNTKKRIHRKKEAKE